MEKKLFPAIYRNILVNSTRELAHGGELKTVIVSLESMQQMIMIELYNTIKAIILDNTLLCYYKQQHTVV